MKISYCTFLGPSHACRVIRSLDQSLWFGGPFAASSGGAAALRDSVFVFVPLSLLAVKPAHDILNTICKMLVSITNILVINCVVSIFLRIRLVEI